ncbi:Ctr copper transporter family [Musa troglodytarum]|uniref:Copper transport protein n=1 Tax=Musa troglodytarum TaxID=320322 RepID=A0A9E7I5U3_9LILI|nr:Ctr copper transporter family [Musa troglodytarum]URE46960.1 Ctr copper transporter family [Musa troglodytarum]
MEMGGGAATGDGMGHEKEMKMTMHMTFFWGENVEILFSGWPGDRGFGIVSRRRCGGMAAVLHAVRMGLAYLVMLAVMSFNGGVLGAAVAGHALGFLLSRSLLLRRAESNHADDIGSAGAGQLPPSKIISSRS